MKTKRVCVDARMLGPYGIGTYIKNMIPFFKDTSVLLQLLIKPEDKDQIHLWDGVDLIDMQAPIYSMQEQWQLPMRIPHCDLFWSPHYNIPLLPIRSRKRLVTIHDMNHVSNYHCLTVLQKIYVKQVMLKAAVRSDQVITNSFFSKEEILRFTQIPEKKITVIPFGINRAHFCEQHLGDDLLLDQCQLPERFFLFVGHLKWHKNLKGVLSALDVLRKREKTPYFLVVIGEDGRAVENLWVQFPFLKPYVKWMSHVSENVLAAIYRHATALIFPSFYEGFGFPPLEAMSTGCPVIASSVSAVPEVCGDAAIYVNPYCVQDILAQMQMLANDENLRKELKEKGIKRAKMLNWQQCADAHMRIIHALCWGGV